MVKFQRYYLKGGTYSECNIHEKITMTGALNPVKVIFRVNFNKLDNDYK